MTTKQTKLTKSARGQECQIRIPEVCNFDPNTTVLAHLNGAGMGMKHHDIHGAYACSDCHRFVDGSASYRKGTPKSIVKLWHLEGVVRTQQLMIKQGLIKVNH